MDRMNDYSHISPPTKIPGHPYVEGQYIVRGTVWASGKRVTPGIVREVRGNMIYIDNQDGTETKLDSSSVTMGEQTALELLRMDAHDISTVRDSDTLGGIVSGPGVVLTPETVSEFGLMRRIDPSSEASYVDLDTNMSALAYVGGGPLSGGGEAFVDINQSLRSGRLPDDPDQVDVVRRLHSLMCPIGGTGQRLFRGLSAPTEDWKVGETIPNGSFLSTSRSLDTGLIFSKYWYAPNPVIIEIEAGPKTRAITVGWDDSDDGDERETTLDFNQGLEITDKRTIMVRSGRGTDHPVTYVSARVVEDPNNPVARLLENRRMDTVRDAVSDYKQYAVEREPMGSTTKVVEYRGTPATQKYVPRSSGRGRADR